MQADRKTDTRDAGATTPDTHATNAAANGSDVNEQLQDSKLSHKDVTASSGATSGMSDAHAAVLGYPHRMSDLTIEIAPLRAQRKGLVAYKPLTDQVVPILKTSDGAVIDDLRRDRDYKLSFARTDKQGVTTTTDVVDAAGTYQVIVTGVGTRLQGSAPATLVVRRAAPYRLIAVLVALLVAGVCAGIYFTQHPESSPWYDADAADGIAGIHGDDLQAYLDAKVEEGMMNITVLNTISFPEGTLKPGEAGFNNLAANHYDQKLSISLDDTGEVVYESGAIKPGQNIQYITLNRNLDSGTYAATASVTGYDPETHEKEGTLNALITIVVGANGA